MTNSTKRKISAREVLADIRAGMTDSQLELKYSISNSSLRMVYRKLVAAGVLRKMSSQQRSEILRPIPRNHFRPATFTAPLVNLSKHPGQRNVPSVAWYLKNWQHFNPIKTSSQ